MDSLRLGLKGLSSAEQSLVQTLFRLHRVEPSFIWLYAAEAPFDALLVDASCSPAEIELIQEAGMRIMWLAPQGVDSEPGVMKRPIRSDVLVRWLNSIEIEILHGRRGQFASTPLESPSPQDVLKSDQSLEWTHLQEHKRPSGLPSQAAPMAGRYKLRRWPSATALAGDVSRIRIATMLSRRYLSIAELSTLTRVSAFSCEEFVGGLLREGVLDSQAMRVEVSTRVPEPVDTRRRGVGRSLIKSIRQRFGI